MKPLLYQRKPDLLTYYNIDFLVCLPNSVIFIKFS